MKKTIEVKELEELNPQLLSMYVRTIYLDTNRDTITNSELANLIQDTFNVKCTEKDISNYQTYFVEQDYEMLSREIEYELNCEL